MFFPFVKALNWRVTVVRGACCLVCVLLVGCSAGSKQTKDISRLESSLQDIRSYQAEQTTRIASLESLVRRLSGRIEEMEFGQSHQMGGLGGDVSNLKEDLSKLKRRVPPPPIVPVMALEADEALVRRLSPEVGRSFGNALARVREGNYREAFPLLNDALEGSINRDSAANIQFWIAVSYDGLGEANKALGAYHEVASQYPKHPRTALALLRQASVFVRLGDTSTARLTLKKLMAEFPDSSEAQQAKEKLKKLS